MKRIGLAICSVWRWLVRVGPVVLTGMSAFYLFFVIAPFFLLGVYQVPLQVLMGDEIIYEKAMGVTAGLVAFFLVEFGLGAAIATWAWLLSLVNFTKTRKLWVLASLLLAPLPIAYVNAGPYCRHIVEWMWGD